CHSCSLDCECGNMETIRYGNSYTKEAVFTKAGACLYSTGKDYSVRKHQGSKELGPACGRKQGFGMILAKQIDDLTTQAETAAQWSRRQQAAPLTACADSAVRDLGLGMVPGGPVLPTLDRSESVLDANIGQRFPRQAPPLSLPAEPW